MSILCYLCAVVSVRSPLKVTLYISISMGVTYKQSQKKVQYCGHTVPHPQAHAVSHSVSQGDQRQFSPWPEKLIPHFRLADPNLQRQPLALRLPAESSRTGCGGQLLCALGTILSSLLFSHAILKTPGFCPWQPGSGKSPTGRPRPVFPSSCSEDCTVKTLAI